MKIKQLNLAEAKAKLSHLVDQAARGKTVVIAKAGFPIAKLVPLDAEPKQIKFGVLEGTLSKLGPQIGCLFPIGNMQGYLNFKAYGEFDRLDRPSGWNARLTFAISPAAPTPTAPPRLIITK